MINFFGRNSSGKVNINGRVFTGSSITINDNEVYVDGVKQDGYPVQKIEVTVISGVESITSEQSINIRGNVLAKSITAGSSISCDDITGDVRAGSSVNCDDVRGNITAGSSVNCDKIVGNVTAKNVSRY